VSTRLLYRQIGHVQVRGEVRDSPGSDDSNVLEFQFDAFSQTSVPGRYFRSEAHQRSIRL